MTDETITLNAKGLENFKRDALERVWLARKCDGQSNEYLNKYVKEFLALFESEDRALVVISLHKTLFPARTRRSSQAWWQWMNEGWSGFDRIPHKDFQKRFKQYRTNWSAAYMEREAREKYELLPIEFDVFRGQNATSAVGISWTCERAVAERFALGHRQFFNSSPVILKAHVRKSEVAFITMSRNESEAVLFSVPRHCELERL